jgi:hypothetical protein
MPNFDNRGLELSSVIRVSNRDSGDQTLIIISLKRVGLEQDFAVLN